MSAKPYTRTQPSDKPNRNVFDMSHANNLTLKFGNLYPVLCKEVVPGDTFEIDATFGLRFMPLVFPVQTRMRADLHFFYVRNRNLWKNWKKFFSRTSNAPLQLPYISKRAGDFWKIGGLADYLGVPVSLIGKETSARFNKSYSAGTTHLFFSGPNSLSFTSPQYFLTNSARFHIGSSFSASPVFEHSIIYNDEVYYIVTKTPLFSLDKISSVFTGNTFDLTFTTSDLNYEDGAIKFKLFFVQNDKVIAVWNNKMNKITNNTQTRIDSSDYIANSIMTTDGVFSGTAQEFMNEMAARGRDNTIDVYGCIFADTITPFVNKTNADVRLPNLYSVKYTYNGVNDLKNAPLANNPFASENDNTAPKVPISALAFRGYEAIYNAFYRDQINDPFIKNGSPEYDEFITNDGDGADSTDYKLYQRNWEQDVFTTAMPSPQQGIAPLLGMSDSNQFSVPFYDMSFTDSNGEKQSIQVIKDADNKLSFTVAGDTLNNMPENVQGALSVLNNASTFGISINDLRNVNALQKWLEKAVRNGFRYKDQMQSHFGIEISLKELQIPEYIGGVSKDIDVNVITQQGPASNQFGDMDVLGHQAGIGTAIGTPKHTVSNYCDEHGFIIGILSVVPIPTYSQSLPKHFTKFEPLDFYSPEFSHIGPQPIPIKEITPLQVSDGKYNKTFGYQRAWYDYFSSIDTVHGQFRSTLKDYLVNRTFQTPPELSHDFLVVKNEDVNDIFAVNNEDEDNIVGQIYFDIKAVRPFPKYGTPSIE